MTMMLASVSNCFEVEKLLTSNVDIIDLKDPLKGALGALSYDEVKKIVKLVKQQRTLSATIGDIESPGLISHAIQKMSATGVDIVKVGIFTHTLDNEMLNILSEKAYAGINIVLVFFADIGYPLQGLNQLSAAGIKGVMLDTANKSSGSLRTILSMERLAEFISVAHQHGLLTGLAGSLRETDIEPLLPLEPDYLGFRGAICRDSQRINEIDINAVLRIRALIYNEYINEFLIQSA